MNMPLNLFHRIFFVESRDFAQKSRAAPGQSQYRNAVASGRTLMVNDPRKSYSTGDPTLPRYGTDFVQVWGLTFEADPKSCIPQKSDTRIASIRVVKSQQNL